MGNLSLPGGILKILKVKEADIVSGCGIGAQGILLTGTSPGEYEQ